MKLHNLYQSIGPLLSTIALHQLLIALHLFSSSIRQNDLSLPHSAGCVGRQQRHQLHTGYQLVRQRSLDIRFLQLISPVPLYFESKVYIVTLQLVITTTYSMLNRVQSQALQHQREKEGVGLEEGQAILCQCFSGRRQ